MPAPVKPAVRSRNNKPELTKDYSYPASGMGSGSDSDRGARQSAYVSSTTNNNSMFKTMRDLAKEDNYFNNDTSPYNGLAKTKKVPQQNPRSTTPSNKPNNTNFIKINKKVVSSISTNKTPPSVSQNHSIKSQRPVASAQSSARTVLNRPGTPKLDKKKSAQSTGASSGDSSVQKATSPSARRPASPPATTHHASAHHRSHVRADSPDNGLREENKKLKRLLAIRNELLAEKQREFNEMEDIKDALEERNRDLNNRVRELERLVREGTKKQTPDDTIGILSSIMNNHKRIIGAQANATPVPSLSSLIGTNDKNGSSPVARPPVSQTPVTTVATTKKDQEPNKVNKNSNNNSVRSVAPVASSVRPHVSSTPPKPAVQNSKKVERSGLSPFPVGRPTGSLDKRVKGNMVYAKKTAADLNVVMESDGSDTDEFTFENDTDDNSSDHTAEDDSAEDESTGDESTEDDSESTSTDDGEEYDDDDDDEGDCNGEDEVVERRKLLIPRDTLNLDDDDSARGHGRLVNNRDDNDDVDHFSKHDLNAIDEEGDDDEDDEFELDPSLQEEIRQKRSLASLNPVASASLNSSLASNIPAIDNDSPKNNARRRLRRNNADSSGPRKENQSTANSTVSASILSDQNGSPVLNGQSVYSSSYSNMIHGNVLTPNNQRSQPHPNAKLQNSNISPVSIKDYPHRDSMSSISSDSSDSSDSTTFSKNGSYPSSATSSSSDDNNELSLSSSYVSNHNQNDLNPSSAHHATSYDDHHVVQSCSSRSTSTSNSSTGHNNTDSVPVSRLPSPTFATSTRLSGLSSSQPLVSAKSRNNRYPQNTHRTPSPVSPSNARARSPASESSRSASNQPRRTRLHESSNYDDAESSSNGNFVRPPPPPPSTKDQVATLQHFLRLISYQCVQGNNSPQNIYDIKKVIDEGSSAKVYTAHPVANRKEELAMKIVPLTYSLEFIFNEIYVLKNFKHENIVDFKESFLRWDGKTREVWIALEKCARGDVTGRAGKISEREVSRIARELLQALKHLHSHGIIHRDIKLSNILATANNDIKLADFGIASLTPTSTTAMVGTIPYMAPDVVLVSPDRPYDTKADIWSLGVCILELLSGKAAWGRIRDDEIMDKLRKGEMPCGFQRLVDKTEIGWEAKDFLQKCFASTADARWSAEKLLEHKFIKDNLY